MGRKKRTQIRFKQIAKRKKRREHLSKKGKNPNDFFSSGFYVTKRPK